MHLLKSNVLSHIHLKRRQNSGATANSIAFILCLAAVGSVTGLAQDTQFVLDREGRTMVLEPYGPNIFRITLSKDKASAVATPGYGLVGTPSMTGWTHQQDAEGNDVFRSDRLVVHVSPDQVPPSRLPHPMPLDELNQSLRDHYFGGSSGTRRSDDTVSVTTASGKPLLTMRNWSMVPNDSDAAAPNGAKPNDAGSRVSAIFDSPPDEHYYGLGQQQQGALDLRDHRINCWHDYSAIGGENVCVPFMISSRGYGLVWDNPSKTTVDLGFNQRSVWSGLDSGIVLAGSS